MNMIQHAVEDFICLYDKVVESIGDNQTNVQIISNDEIRAYAQTLRPGYNRGGGRNREEGDK